MNYKIISLLRTLILVLIIPVSLSCEKNNGNGGTEPEDIEKIPMGTIEIEFRTPHGPLRQGCIIRAELGLAVRRLQEVVRVDAQPPVFEAGVELKGVVLCTDVRDHLRPADAPSPAKTRHLEATPGYRCQPWKRGGNSHCCTPSRFIRVPP